MSSRVPSAAPGPGPAPAWLVGAQGGALVGLAEAVAVVRYDWIMDEPTPPRLLGAAGWALALVGLGAAGWAPLLGGLRRWPLLGWGLAAGLVGAGRVALGDGFEPWMGALGAAAALLGGLTGRWPALRGAAAAALALFALWGRVPRDAWPLVDQAAFLAPGALLAALLGALTARAARPAAALGPLLLPLLGLPLMGLLRSDRPAGDGARPPSLLIVLVDTLRRDAVQPYGEGPTPALAALAAGGLTLRDAITVIPKTTQSVAAFQTGLPPQRSGVRQLSDTLAAGQTTLAEHLRAQGYRTGAVVHNPWVRRGRGFEQGFGQFHSFFEIERPWGPLRYSGLLGAIDALGPGWARAFGPDTDSARAVDAALGWLGQTPQDQPFYLYVHTFDPHWPYRPPGQEVELKVNDPEAHGVSKAELIFANPFPDADNDAAIGVYGQEVGYNDAQIGRLLAGLEALGRADDTVVVFTADHGHHLGDHGYWYHHGSFLYEPGLQIPMIVRAPGQLQPGSALDLQFRNIDLLPSALEWLGAPPLPGVEGRPLSRLLAEGAPPAYLEADPIPFRTNRRRPVKGLDGNPRGLRHGRWKLLLTPTPEGGAWELYDLQTDPAELRNLIADPPAEADLPGLRAAFAAAVPADDRARLEALGVDLGGDPSVPPIGTSPGAAPAAPQLSDNEAEMLRAMGYLDD